MDIIALFTQVREIISLVQAADTWSKKIEVAVLVGKLIFDLVQKLQSEPEPVEPIRFASAPCETVDDCCAALESVCADNTPAEGTFQAGGGGALIMILLPLFAKLLEKLLSK